MLFLLFLFLLFQLLLGLGCFIFIQYRKHHKAKELYNQAKELEKKDAKSPYDTTKLNKAIKLYKQCNQLVNKPEFIKAAKQCQRKIDDRLEFQNLVSEGRKKAKKNYFREALHNFRQAKKLFVTKELEDEIFKYQQSIEQQVNYEKILEQSAQIARQGEFQEAINLLKPSLDEFSREDGQQLLSKLQQVTSAKDLYKSGLSAEKTGQLRDAVSKYRQALNLVPEFTECNIRLAIIDLKTSPNQAISHLEKIESQQAAYIRGFARAQLKNWQQANREWKSVRHNKINSQRNTIKCLAERERLVKIKEIETAVDNNNFEIAKTLSLEFINKFGYESIIQKNLENHIQPLLERQVWSTENWQKIVNKTESNWLEKQDIKSLHNWAIASYYLAQTYPHKLVDFIIAWSTALANIEYNPTLQNIPWLGSNSVDIKDVAAKLKQILENAIDAVKDKDIKKYLKLRDIYRQEMVTLSLIQQNASGMRIKQQLLILPGCYQRFRDGYPGVKFPGSVWGALYTDWGKAVAACHEGDTARAVKIKPSNNPTSETERFANCFVSYHEGCHYLQNLEWHKAINPLQQAQSEIKAKSDWCKEIDRLCELQRKKIDDFDEHLQFSKFWYELVDSQPSRSYFAEYKGRKVADKISNEEINFQQGLKELQDIKGIDPNNSFILNFIETVEIQVELEKIARAMKREFREAIRIAKRSRHEQVRFRVAEICINILLEGSQNRDLDFDAMYQFAKWASELCPHEPAFMPIYSKLGIY